MPGPAALIALAARLGISQATKKLREKGFKYLRKLVTKAEKQIAKQQKTAGKKFTGEGPKRKQEPATQRKKPITKEKPAKGTRKNRPKTYPPRTLKKLNEVTNITERRKIIEKYPGIKPDLKIKNNHN